MRLTTTRILLSSALALSLSAVEARAATLAAQVSVTGVDLATVGTVLHQSPGPALAVATSPPNTGDLSLLVGGSPLTQAAGVIMAHPNQFQYAAVGNRNLIETPGELTGTVPAGFPAGMWLSTTNVSGAGTENNFNFSMVQFPFSDGWKAGHIDRVTGAFLAGNSAGVTVTALPNLPNTDYGLGHFVLSIAGVDSRTSGMLFGMSEENSSSGNGFVAGILPDGSGWDIRTHDQGAQFPLSEQAEWSFVYVPYATQNLVAAGQLSLTGGTTLSVLSSVGTFTASRVDLGVNGSITPPTAADGLIDAGRFLIQIPGKDDTTGVLMVGVSKLASLAASAGFPGVTNFGADDNWLAYQYNAGLGGFLVETYDFPGATLQDSDIYFAYFDYSNPIVPEPGTASLAIAALGALGAGGVARRRFKGR